MSKRTKHKRDTTDYIALRRAERRRFEEIYNRSREQQATFDNRVFNPTNDFRKPFRSVKNSIKRIYSYTPTALFNKNVKRLKRAVVPTRQGYDFANMNHWALYPRQTMVCLRRKLRRQVLFSIKKTGGGSSRRKKHYNEDSNITCKRR